jgi:hypothetical protein
MNSTNGPSTAHLNYTLRCPGAHGMARLCPVFDSVFWRLALANSAEHLRAQFNVLFKSKNKKWNAAGHYISTCLDNEGLDVFIRHVFTLPHFDFDDSAPCLRQRHATL